MKNQENSINQEKYTVAAFDFDGTLTTKDTLFQFIKYAFGLPKFVMGMLWFVPIYLKNKLGLLSNSQAKELLITYFFEGMSFEKFNQLGISFKNEIEKMTNSKTFELLDWHKNQGHKIIIVSASVENWIAPWAQSVGFDCVIATKLEIKKGSLTGKFASNNCNGPEKIKRLLSEYPDRSNYVLYAYGDSDGDKELLAGADFPHYLRR